jgi:LacI family transcriptional regulator
MSSERRQSSASGRPVGIKDIARALGISTGTVDRALHGKPGVNASTRARVLSTAKSLGYRPNLAARYLKSRRQIRISVHLPTEIAVFWDSLREGIRQAAAPFAPALHVDFRRYPRLGEGDIALFEQALEDHTTGLIVAPGNPDAMTPCLRRAACQGVPVVCVITDAPSAPRLASVSADPFTIGAVAGELLARFRPGGGKVAFFTGWLSMQEHAEKLRGFKSGLGITGTLELGPIVEAHDDERQAYRGAVAVLREHPDLRAVYVSTVNSLPVLHAAEHEGRLPGLTIVATDLFPELVVRIRSGAVAATVYQRPLTQGRMALEALHQFLLTGQRPSERIHVVPHLVMRSNLEMFLQKLPVDLEASSASAGADHARPRRREVRAGAAPRLPRRTPKEARSRR